MPRTAKFKTSFLKSRVSRRIFTLFIFCALIPITVLAVLSFKHVTKQLNEHTQRRLHQSSKTMGMNIYERLLFLESEMSMVASNLRADSGAVINTLEQGSNDRLKQMFTGLALVSGTSLYAPLFGSIKNLPELTGLEKRHLSSSKSVVSSEYHPELPSRIFMSMAVDPKRPDLGVLIGEINNTYLWGAAYGETLPAMTELCVLDQSNNMLFCSLKGHVSLPGQAALEMARSISGQFEWKHENMDYLASYWTIFMKSNFFAPKWTIMLSESKADVLAPMANFKKTFPFVVLLSMLVVVLLSINLIRRNLVPLEKLREGTRRIAMRDFDSRVAVFSGDEFEELALSFNNMAGQLGRHINTLTTIAEIDRAILSALDAGKIVETVIIRMREIFPCDCVSVTIFDTTYTAKVYTSGGDTEKEKQGESVNLMPEEVGKLHDNPESLLITGAETGLPGYLAHLQTRGLGSFLVLPVFLKQKLSGIITMGYAEKPALDREDLDQARQLVDQVAVALSNAGLIKELSQLHWGTLTALARAVDAKSPWTAGHSERVTDLALKIGRVLGIRREELDNLHRAGLLHDIGKIAIPLAILDKPGALTDEEFAVIKEHPLKGASILEPIDAYTDVIPVVLHHHERVDGGGYPDGLAGADICLGARILAVADVFDAVTSDRPYRAGQSREKAIEIINHGSGRQFDPKVARAFLEVMAQDESWPEGREALDI